MKFFYWWQSQRSPTHNQSHLPKSSHTLASKIHDNAACDSQGKLALPPPAPHNDSAHRLRKYRSEGEEENEMIPHPSPPPPQTGESGLTIFDRCTGWYNRALCCPRPKREPVNQAHRFSGAGTARLRPFRLFFRRRRCRPATRTASRRRSSWAWAPRTHLAPKRG